MRKVFSSKTVAAANKTRAMSLLKLETICGLRIEKWIIRCHLFDSNFQLFSPLAPTLVVAAVTFAIEHYLHWVMEMNILRWGKSFSFCILSLPNDIMAERDIIPFGGNVYDGSRSRSLTSHISRKSCCSTRNNSHVVFVTTVLSRGKSCRTDSPNVAPTPRLQRVIGLCGWMRRD